MRAEDIRTLPALRKVLQIAPVGSLVHIDPRTLDAQAAKYLESLVPRALRSEDANMYRILHSDGVTNRLPSCLADVRRIVERMTIGSWVHISYDLLTRQARNYLHRCLYIGKLTEIPMEPGMYRLNAVTEDTTEG